MKLGIESEILEFKKTTREIDESLKSISAMLNKHCEGTVYFGVNNEGEVIGQQIASSTLRDISKAIADKIRPTIFPAIDCLNTNGLAYIRVCFKGNERPYSANGLYYIRVADEDRKISVNKLKELFESLEADYSQWENKLSDETIDDVDTSAMDAFISLLNLTGKPAENIGDAETVLAKLGLLVDGRLNNAGRFLFSKNNPIKMKLAVFASDEEITFIDQNPVSGNIITLIGKAQKYIETNIHWRSIISAGPRQEIPEIPLAAIKEAIINSFAHAKYSSLTTHEISITPNKISIYNPGLFPSEFKPEDFAFRRLKSLIKNPLIANALFQAKLIESWGTGFKRIFSLCDDHNIKVDYRQEEYGFCLVFYRPGFNVSFATNLNVPDLDDVSQAILALIKGNNKITIGALANAIFKSKQTVVTKLKILKHQGYIKRVGTDKKGYYKVLKHH